MSKKRNYYTTAKKAKIGIAAIENKMTQAQLTSEYGVHATQIKTWKQKGLQAIYDAFSSAREKEIKEHEELVEKLYQEIGHLQAQLSWLKKKCQNELSGET